MGKGCHGAEGILRASFSFRTWGNLLETKVKVKSLSRVRLFVTPWTIAYQAPPSMIFSRQEYWNGLLFPSPGDLPDPGIEPGSPALEADALTSEPPGKPHIIEPMSISGFEKVPWTYKMILSLEESG